MSAIGTQTYTYASDNKMLYSPGTGLGYDPLGRLHLTASNVLRDYDGVDLIDEKDWTNGTMQRRYVHGPGADEPIVWYEGSGTTDRRWLHADERGSIIAVSNGSGAVTNINSYDEYGVPASGNVGRFQYTGQAWIPELGMYYYKARIYNPAIGRFMQTDPIGYMAGVNLYGYVGGDPVNLTDPLGLETTYDGNQWTVAPVSSGGSGGLGGFSGFSGTGFVGSGGTFADEPDIIITARYRNKKRMPAPGRLEPQRTQTPTPCQAAFLKDQLGSRGLPTSQIDNLKFVSGLDSNANALTRNAFNGGASAVTQGSTVYVQPGSFNTVANFRSPTGFEEAYHTAQFASDSGFYSTYGILSVGGFLLGDSYNGNAYEAFAKGASKQMFAASKTGMCPK